MELIKYLNNLWKDTISPTIKAHWDKADKRTDRIINSIREDISINNPDDISNPIVEAQNATTRAIEQIKLPEHKGDIEVALKGVSLVAIKGERGERGEDGKDGINGKDGYTPKKFKDYFTKDEIDQIIKKVLKSIRIPEDGEDGYSPVAGEDYPTYTEIKKQIEEAVALFPIPENGKIPSHEWNEEKTQVRFETPDGEWGEWSDILKGENGKVIGYGGGWVKNFIEMDDTPLHYTGQAGKIVKVNSTENGLEFVTPQSIEDVNWGEIGGTLSNQTDLNTELGTKVIAPSTNTDSYIPQWDGTDSKTLKNGLAVPAGGLAGVSQIRQFSYFV